MDNDRALSLTKCWLYVRKNAPRCFNPKNFDIPKKNDYQRLQVMLMILSNIEPNLKALFDVGFLGDFC